MTDKISLAEKLLELIQDQRKRLEEKEAALKMLLGMNGKITDSTVVLGK